VSINRFLISLESNKKRYQCHLPFSPYSSSVTYYLAKSKKASSTPMFAFALVSMNWIPSSLAKVSPCSFVTAYRRAMQYESTGRCRDRERDSERAIKPPYPFFFHITLVSNQYLVHTFICMLFNVGEPVSDIYENQMLFSLACYRVFFSMTYFQKIARR
jgi:hypothetical protein